MVVSPHFLLETLFSVLVYKLCVSFRWGNVSVFYKDSPHSIPHDQWRGETGGLVTYLLL